MYMHQQEATCGLLVCQHPLCWATNRQAARGLFGTVDKSGVKKSESNLRFSNTDNRIIEKEIEDDIDDDDDDNEFLDGLPKMTIFNMLDDYGYDVKDQYPTTSFTSMLHQDYKSGKSANLPPEGARIIPKLTLKSLASHSVEDVTAPANTPLHSAHGFGDYHEYTVQPNKYGSHKHALTETNVSINGSNSNVRKGGYRKVQLEIDDKNSGSKPKKMLIWCPTPKPRRIKHYLQSQRKTPPSLRAVSLPLSSVPEFKNKDTRNKAIKGTIPKRTQPAYATARKMRAVKDAATVSQPRGASGATPQEIAQLRKVPVDVLIRVLHQAEENEIITKGQTNYLLAQVVGKRDLLPSIKETPKHTINKAAQNEEEPRTPLETKNLKILNAQDARLHSPRTVSVEPIYKMDTNPHTAKHTSTPRDINIPKKDQGLGLLRPKRDDVHHIPNDNDSQYDEKLRDFAEENLRSIGVRSPKKTPVKYVATLFDEGMTSTSPIKPFHYPKSPRDIFLGPIPTPPPPSPPTERDSLYDAQVGGSTMLVNASSTGPSTIASYKHTSSRSGSKTPTTGRDIDGRFVKMTQAGMIVTQKQRSHIASPFDSSSGPDGWPQLNEEDFLRTGGSSELAGSPIPSFTEEEIRAISRNESIVSGREETPLSDKFQNLQQGEIHSPAPPPPSPEPMVPANRLAIEGTTRDRGAATALGLVTLNKTSLQSTPETGGGLTPTPVVSSVTSGVETPFGRPTRPQTLGSSPVIPETPYENDSEEGSPVDDKMPNEQLKETTTHDIDSIVIGKADTGHISGSDFETNVSPEIAKDELESEMEKLNIIS